MTVSVTFIPRFYEIGRREEAGKFAEDGTPRPRPWSSRGRVGIIESTTPGDPSKRRPAPIEPEVTRILDAIARGDGQAARDLLPLVYDELRRLAARRLALETPGQTLQATALVHEAYLRLVGPDSGKPWDGRGHFYAAAAEAMRRIVIDRARDRKRLKRGGARRRESLDLDALAGDDAPPDDLLDLDEALGRLAAIDPRGAKLVKLRLYAGLNLDEAAKALGVVRRTAERDWAFARAWLFRQLDPKNLP
jgi:RNA polymerase sigma factor (TIGR02999 family)